MIISRYEFYHRAAVDYVRNFMRDAEFSEADVRLSHADQTLTMPFRQYVYDLVQYRREGLILWQKSIPQCHCSLIFESATAFYIDRDNPDDPTNHSIGGMFFDPVSNTFTVDTYEGATLRLAITALRGKLEVSDDPAHFKTYRTLRVWSPRGRLDEENGTSQSNISSGH